MSILWNEYTGNVLIAVICISVILCCCLQCFKWLRYSDSGVTRLRSYNNNAVDRSSEWGNTAQNFDNRFYDRNFRHSTYNSPHYDSNSPFIRSPVPFIRDFYPIHQNRYNRLNNAVHNHDNRFNITNNLRQSASLIAASSNTRLLNSSYTRLYEPIIRAHPSIYENNYDVYERPISQNKDLLIEKLMDSIVLLKNQAEAQSQQIIAENARFLVGDEKLMLVCDNLKTDDLKKEQTKVKLTSNLHSSNFLICTVINYGPYQLELKLRQGTNFQRFEKERGLFKVTIYANYDEIEFAENGYKNICKDERMLKKLLAYNDENSEILMPYCLLKSKLYDRIKLAAAPSKHILICSKQNRDIENFALALKATVPDIFQRYPVTRIVTMHRSNLSPDLSKYTKTFDEITNIQSYSIIFCTMGVVPKLIQHKQYGLTSNYFKKIYIVEAQKASELDCWMVIGHAANVNTKIYICGTKVKERHRSYNRYDQQANTTKDKSMFKRLLKKHSRLHNNTDFFVYKL